MSLVVYYQSPFNIGSEVGQVDTFSGNGVETTFPVINKPISDVAGTIQYSGTFKRRFNGGFSISGSNIVIDTPVPNGVQGVIPAQVGIVLSGYDSDDVSGVDSPRVDIQPFYIGDVDDIGVYSYEPRAGQPGIALTVVDLISAVGADLTWLTLACSNPVDGTALTFLATGETLYTPRIYGFTQIASGGIWAGANHCIVETATSIIAGDYIKIDTGSVSQEVIKVISITGTTQLNFDGTLNYSHSAGETVYSSLRKFFIRMEVPVNSTGNSAINLYDLSLNIAATKVTRT